MNFTRKGLTGDLQPPDSHGSASGGRVRVMEFEFEADDAGAQQVWVWIDAKWSPGDANLSIPLLATGIDHRRDVIQTRAAKRSRGKARYLLVLHDSADGLMFAQTFKGIGIINIVAQRP